MWLEGTGLEGRGWSVEVVIVHLAACKYCVASDSIAVLDFIIGGCHDQFTATAALSWPSTKHGGRCICQSAATTPGGHDCNRQRLVYLCWALHHCREQTRTV